MIVVNQVYNKSFAQYVIMKSNRVTEDLVQYTTYGINYYTSTGDTLYSIKDISSDRTLVELMVNLFNTSKLPLYRFRQAVCSLLP